VTNADDDLRALLSELSPKARDTLRRVLIHDQADRDAFASQLLRYRGGRGDDWADIIDMLTMYPRSGVRSFVCSASWRSRPRRLSLSQRPRIHFGPRHRCVVLARQDAFGSRTDNGQFTPRV
jgi:hypothetical protein